MDTSRENFVKKTLQLLEKERQAEIDETKLLRESVSPKELEQQGVCLLKLRLSSQHSGLYGRTVIVLEPYWPGKDLPAHNFTPGDIAGLSLSTGDSTQEVLASGIVSKVTQSSVSLAFDESYDASSLDDGVQYRITKLANDVTYRRMKRALTELHKFRSGRASHLIDVLFGSTPAPPISSARDGEKAKHIADMVFYNENLDWSQRDAVEFALCQRDLAVIHGPPGTGKTTTVVEIIRQVVKQGGKILVCAPSNIAVDNLVERLAGYAIGIIRLGHPARLLHTIQKFSLDAVIAHSDEADVVNGIKKDLEKTWSELRKANNDKGKKQSLRLEMKMLRKDLRKQEETATTRVLKAAQVVLATLTTSSRDGPLKYLEEDHFDLVIIDECSQALEAACWLPLLQSPKCVLAGDHKQLPPTIISHQAAKEGLEETLMERQISLHGDKVVRMLTMQYRMNSLIMDWSSEQLYDGRLEAHESVAQHLLKDLPGVSENEDTQNALLLIDTTGCDMTELSLTSEVSRGNEGEVELVAAHVKCLVSSGLDPKDIAIITPYNLQVELLRLKLLPTHPGLEIKSVDGFQGREKEAVVISLVRSNPKGEVGFLSEDRRLNVAITRARRHLALVCDTETVSNHGFLKTLMEYMTNHGEVRSAQQYIQDGLVNMNSKRSDFLESKMASAANHQAKSAAKNKSAKGKKASKVPTGKGGDKSVTPKVSSGQDDDTQKEREISAEEQAEITELTQVLEQFLISEQQVHVFPSSLTPRQRYQVHELADGLGLLHFSQGEGEDRHIAVRKPKPGEKQKPREVKPRIKDSKDNQPVFDNDSKKSTSNNHGKVSRENVSQREKVQDGTRAKTVTNRVTKDEATKAVTKDESDDEDLAIADSDVNTCDIVCDKCGKHMPAGNLDLHQLRCTGPPPSSQVKERVKSKQKKKKIEKPTERVEEDFDSLIEAAMNENKSCAFKKCKQGTSTLGQNCEFCSKRFCLQHHIPEVHGCGDAAKSRARQMISREGVLYRGSGIPDKTLDPAKRAHLQRKLDKKLTELSGERTVKKKKEKK